MCGSPKTGTLTQGSARRCCRRASPAEAISPSPADHTPEWSASCEAPAPTNEPCRLWSLGSDHGVSFARNAVMSESRGDTPAVGLLIRDQQPHAALVISPSAQRHRSSRPQWNTGGQAQAESAPSRPHPHLRSPLSDRLRRSQRVDHGTSRPPPFAVTVQAWRGCSPHGDRRSEGTR